jgi:hypothetical protein
MLGAQHEAAGGVIGLIFSFWLLVQHQSILLVIGCFLISIWGANLPDLLDPPTSRFHRSIGHNFISFFLFLIVSFIALALAILIKQGIFETAFILIASFSFSVLSHLVLDMLTPMGLPMFVGKSLLGIIEIPLFLIPVINIVMVIITIVLAIKSIKYLAKKIGGKLALILLFIPVWGSLLLLGIALLSVAWLKWLGFVLLFIFLWCIIILFLIGHSIDVHLKKKLIKKSDDELAK